LEFNVPFQHKCGYIETTIFTDGTRLISVTMQTYMYSSYIRCTCNVLMCFHFVCNSYELTRECKCTTTSVVYLLGLA